VHRTLRAQRNPAQRVIDILENASGHGKLANDEGIKPRLDKKRKNLKRLVVAF
jgi:hypothetical protein